MQQTVKVWDLLVRLFHWSLVAFFTLAWLTGEGDLDSLHAWVGYIIGGLIAFRILWGFIGSKHARFSDFVRRPAQVTAYLKSLLTTHPKHYLGHNPAGGLMVVLMLAVLALVTWTGLETYAAEGKGPLAGNTITLEITPAYADDWEFDEHGNEGDEFWEEIHEATVNLMLLLILVHLGGVFISSLLHRENLLRAMITGSKTIEKQPDEN